MMYHLIGDNIGRAFKNESPEDRMEAIKTLVGLTATHVAMAGALGLPTEPFKYLLMGAQAAGLTSVGWGDVEDKVRQTASNYFGKTGGEILTRGLPRLAGVDLSSRVGPQLMAAWANAKPSAKFSAWKDVQAFNKGKPREAQISMSQLTSYADRRQKEGNQALRPGTKDKFIMDRVNATYNP
jgi:hypothetical protein